ncbi:MAG: sensor histidine kinase [Sphaerochaetaceae bacterium]|jgi:two-component system sensor histidine kinase KdpD
MRLRWNVQKNNNLVSWLENLGKTAALLFVATIINIFMLNTESVASNASEIYVLAVLLTSLWTNGFIWGLIASIFGVFGTNYFFTYPYFAFNFTISGYPVTFVSMLLVAMITSTLAAGLKEQMSLTKAREQKTRQLNEVSQQLLKVQSSKETAELACHWLSNFLGRATRFYLDPVSFIQEGTIGEDVDELHEAGIVRNIFATGESAVSAFSYSPLTSRENVIAVIAILSTKDLPPISKETENFLQLIFSQFVMVLERQHLEDDRQMIVMEQQKERMRGNLLRAISHDLRTPLTGIIGASSAILDNRGKIDAQDMFHLVSDINTDAMWLLRMVENVLSVTRIDNEAATKLHKSTEPIEEVVSQAVQKTKKHFPDCKLQVKVPDEFIMAYMDSTLIEQVVINLIENAIRHSESTEPIEVSVEVSDDNHVQFSVRDHGKGIAAEELPILFEGFSIRNNEKNDSSRGLGIGLSICKSIILAHGGTISGTNAPDGGALFTFNIPMEKLSDSEE